jgi:hypothetical protein
MLLHYKQQSTGIFQTNMARTRNTLATSVDRKNGGWQMLLHVVFGSELLEF